MFRTGSIVVLILATCLALLAVPAAADPTAQQSPTGFSISNPKVQDYYDHRGGLNTFGYPISREFTFLGSRVQFFQRAVLQLNPDGGVGLLNILDGGLLPYTHINNSTFPGPDASVMGAAPSPADPNYSNMAVLFVKAQAPDEWDGLKVNFFSTFSSTVSYEDAFPNGDGEEGLLPLINLEIWGLPISKPAYDPNNKNFVYLRFQRGIMQFDATTGLTQGILIGDYLKSVITGNNLPLDLAGDARSSNMYLQYTNDSSDGMARGSLLPGTNMFAAFSPDGVAVPTPLPATATPIPAAQAPIAGSPVPANTQVASQPQPPSAIAVTGASWFVEQTNNALDMLSTKAPANFVSVRQYVYAIAQTSAQASYIDFNTRTLFVREPDAFPANWRDRRDVQIQWYATLIARNALHIEQWANGRPYNTYDANQESLVRQWEVALQVESTDPPKQLSNYLKDVIDRKEGSQDDWGNPRGPVATAVPTPEVQLR